MRPTLRWSTRWPPIARSRRSPFSAFPIRAGESVYAVVFGRMQVAPDELVARCRARVAGFEVPRFVELRAGLLPESAAGKILERDLREPHWAGQRAHVSGG